MLTILISSAVVGALLGFLARLSTRGQAHSKLVTAIDATLPQLQCGECGYVGCRPYAEAIANQEAPIDLCPPGGMETAKQLAQLTQNDIPAMPDAPPLPVAYIRADECVGCALCLPACPTDAIIGAPRKDHVVLTEECVGCQLCIPPCPVDCIEMRPAPLSSVR